ncbi:hypothetical protein [Schinkia azotoformans]|uniref:hypothetical protein n=1 Tax=Schinkia azotoformans TaxID=1454 RepID=UPI002DBA8978|nr:hypothetical protein [Schinkia azotoformans]MEC1757362.1 hypothetical protein [Schinkia azotoformans]
MPELTPRLGIKKSIGTENVTRQSFNENYDIIDQMVETIAGAQEKATTAENNAKTYTDNKVSGLNADAVGAHPKITNGTNVWQFKVDINGSLYIEQVL